MDLNFDMINQVGMHQLRHLLNTETDIQRRISCQGIVVAELGMNLNPRIFDEILFARVSYLRLLEATT